MEKINNIIETMISQHRALQKDLVEALDLSNGENPDFESIISYLKQFRLNLDGHLSLENGVFYPELLIKMKNNSIDTSKIIYFIDQMKEIGDVVVSFLSKNNDLQQIQNNLEDFKKELQDIISTLNLRLESEETGVYMYWDLYK